MMPSNNTNLSNQSNLFRDLCSLLLTLLHSPHLYPPNRPPPHRYFPLRRPITPAGLASMLLGASLSLMVCGSITFVIGFILMPWFLGLVMLFYFLGVMENVTGFWLALFCPLRKEISVALLIFVEVSRKVDKHYAVLGHFFPKAPTNFDCLNDD